MPASEDHRYPADHSVRMAGLALAGAFSLLLTACEKPSGSTGSPSPSSKVPESPVVTPPDPLATRLAAARVDAAKDALSQRRPDRALPLLVSALKLDATSGEAMSLCLRVLAGTTWNIPVATLDHRLPVEQLEFSPPSSLWVGLGGKSATAVRWDLGEMKIRSVLFPTGEEPVRSWSFPPSHRSTVIERGPVTLLCDAETLKPICEIGSLPENLTPSAVIVFSPDGLLMAHPCVAPGEGNRIIWHLRDTATGQIIRSSEPSASGSPRPLAASFDRQRLRILHEDGSLIEMPVSPVEETVFTAMPEPVKLLHAQFSSDGNSVLVLQDLGPHEAPSQSIISYSDHEDGTLTMESLVGRFSWSKHPGLWNGLMRGEAQAPFSVDGGTLEIRFGKHAPVETGTELTAVAFGVGQVITGEQNGRVGIHRLVGPPLQVASEEKPVVDPAGVAALEHLCAALAGTRFDEEARTTPRLSWEDRVAAAKACDAEALDKLFPTLHLSAKLEEIRSLSLRETDAASLKPLDERLQRADPQAAPDPAAVKLVEIFGEGNAEEIPSSIREAGNKGPAAAMALALSLKSEHPEWIEACIADAEDLPPLLRLIATSRIAWLQGRKADALGSWPEVFPTIAETRRKEDWDGWEQVDFQPALDALQDGVRSELEAIEVPANSNEEQRKAVADKLRDPATVEAIGKPRFAEACLKAAMAFSSFKEETETTFQLASLARNLGAAPEPCLRAEALALTAQGDYQNAHPRWIQLITEHPVETHLPGDYAEAAYTAFENMDSRQAMEILTTGMHRFPNDANFALRAGWVSLLTGNSERGYRFLREGQRIGFPEEKRENATALLVIAAAQSGANDDAAVYFQDLMQIDPAWVDAATLDSLDWPEELEASLRMFMN